jgi:cytochrome P450
MLWQGQETLSAYGQAAVANMKANGGTTNIFANVMAEAEKGEKLDDEDVRSEAQNLIVAGTGECHQSFSKAHLLTDIPLPLDTTSISLTYLVYAVLSRPELQHQVEAEVHDLSDGFRDSDVERLELLNAVVNETLRLFGAAAGGLPRVVPEQGLQIGSIFLPSGTVVSTQTYTMHRLEELFPRPLEYVRENYHENNCEG